MGNRNQQTRAIIIKCLQSKSQGKRPGCQCLPVQANGYKLPSLPCQGWGRGFESLRPLQIAYSISRVSRWFSADPPSLSDILQAPSVLRSKTGDSRTARVRGVVASGCLPLSLAFASEGSICVGDFVDVRLSSRNGGQSKGCCDNPCSVAIARPEPARPGCRNLDTAILLGWGLAGARCLTGKVGRMHQDACFPVLRIIEPVCVFY